MFLLHNSQQNTTYIRLLIDKVAELTDRKIYSIREHHAPISFFASVVSDIENLTVSATVFSPQEETELALRDDGLIVPDVTEGDGIYSQYYFDLFQVGFYSAEVSLVDPSTGQ